MAFETRLTQEMIDRYTAAGYWRDKTFFDYLEEVAAKHPEREAIIDARSRVSYGELKDKVERTAAFFKANGIKRGDVVTIQVPNRVEFAYAFFALELIGAIANTINPDFRSREVEFILNFSESKGYVCCREFRNHDYVEMIRGLRESVPGLEVICVVDEDAGDDTICLADGLKSTDPLPASERVHMDANEVCRMAFTSGTTGNPKNVLHSFNTTIPACEFLDRDMEATDKDVFLLYLPIGLNWGYLVLIQGLMLGARVVLQERFTAREALELIEREKVTFIPTAPASIIAMLNDPDLEKFDLSSLGVVITGGASCPVEALREYQRRMSGRLIELYGMLEDGYHTYTRFSDDPEEVNGTIGSVVEGMGLRLLDPAGNDVGPGEQGEIAADGPSVHLGYNKNPQANAEAFTEDGWFRTGDLGMYAEDGKNVRIVGRSKEIINRGGKKFFPREVEEILYTHPKVMHAAMIGVPDPRLGERNCLCLLPKQGADVTLDEFVEFLRGEVATYKLPERMEIFDELPFTPTGKIQRFVLQKMVGDRDEAKA